MDGGVRFIINLHGVGKAPTACEPGEEPYWISGDNLEKLLGIVDRHPRRELIRLTFDDSNRSDYAIAAPALRRYGLRAGFFVLTGRLGRDGYLSKSQVRELCEQGFEIGSHGIDHIDWTKASDDVLTREIKDSKSILEQVTGCLVRSAAIPFGLYDRRILGALRRHGYQEVFSSDGGPRITAAWPIPRYSLRRSDDLSALSDRIESRIAFLSRARTEAWLRFKTL